MYKYGIGVDKLRTLIRKVSPEKTAWGYKFKIAREKDYILERFDILDGKTADLKIKKGWEATVYLEEGIIRIGKHLISHRQSIKLFLNSKIKSDKDSIIYLFYGQISKKKLKLKSRSTFDFREKYWGIIETMVNDLYTGKRLFFKKGQHSSLHFHVQKTETYFIHSGQLLVRLRAGRGEDSFFKLLPGSTLRIPPGLMHQDGGLADTVIIEISTHDEDSDSFIVEDGQKNRMQCLK